MSLFSDVNVAPTFEISMKQKKKSVLCNLLQYLPPDMDPKDSSLTPASTHPAHPALEATAACSF